MHACVSAETCGEVKKESVCAGIAEYAQSPRLRNDATDNSEGDDKDDAVAENAKYEEDDAESAYEADDSEAAYEEDDFIIEYISY